MEEKEPDGLDALTKLEERIRETVEQLRSSRAENAGLRKQIEAFRVERRQILERVDKLLAHIDTLPKG